MLLSTLVLALAETPEFHVEAGGQWTPESLVLDLGARAEGKRDGYLLVAARVAPTGNWLGRAGIGVDLFGGRDGLDLKLGLFLGATGNAREPSIFGRPTAGAELQFGGQIGRVYGWFRHLNGFSGVLENHLTENELRIGFELTDHVRIHGQAVHFNPREKEHDLGFGAGAEFVF